MRTILLLLAAILPVGLGGCGLFVPDKDIFSDNKVVPPNPSPQGKTESNIVAHIRCEIRKGIWDAAKLPNVRWLKEKWGVLVTLKLTADEIAALNPGLSTLTPLDYKATKTLTVGLGLSGTGHATGIETIAFTYSNAELYSEAEKEYKAKAKVSCDQLQNGIMIDSDLKIDQFIYDKAVIAAVGEDTSKAPTEPPFTTMQDEITFVASFGGSVTPTWKFARTTVNPTSPFFSATRTDTNYVELTFGPVDQQASAKAKKTKLSNEAENLHTAALIGSATASNIMSQSVAP